MDEIDDEILQDLYTWVDKIPLTRPKRNMARDFSDAVMCAEVLHHHFPKLLDLHNYVPANNTKQKEENWRLLNRKVLRRLSMELSEDVIKSLALARPFTIERVLLIIRSKIDRAIFEKQRKEESHKQLSDRPEVDQHTGRQKGTSPTRTKPAAGKPASRAPDSPTKQTNQRIRARSPSPFRPPPTGGQVTPLVKSNSAPHPPPSKPAPAPSSSSGSQQRLNNIHNSSRARQKSIAVKTSPPTKQPAPVAAGRGGRESRDKAGPSPGEVLIPVPAWPRANMTARETKQYTSDYTSRLAYEEKAQECLAKEETIEILNAKVRRLEHLVHLKDIRIEDLQARLEELRPTNKRH